MKLKWYFSALLIILTVFGICQEQSAAPNQEIVLQFTNKEIASNHALDVIDAIKQKLQGIEAKYVKVSESKNGRLKITYFSNEEVSTIKERLFIEETEKLNLTSIESENNSPSKNNQDFYNFDVFEIQKPSDSHSDLGGKFIVEHKQDCNRSSNPNQQPYSIEGDNKYSYFSLKTALALSKTNTIVINSTSHNIPEVRAGPINCLRDY